MTRGPSPLRVLLVGDTRSTHFQSWVRCLTDSPLETRVFDLGPVAVNGPKRGRFRSTARRAAGLPARWRELREIENDFQPNVINAHYATSGGAAVMMSKAPTVITVYGSEITEFPLLSPIHRRGLHGLLDRAELLTVASHSLLEGLRFQFPDLGSRARTVPFGVDWEAYQGASQGGSATVAPTPSGVVVFGTVKSNEYVYGVDRLIRAFSDLQDRHTGQEELRLVIVGGGSLLQAHRSLAEELGLEGSVTFKGPVSHDEVPEVLEGFDVFCALSRRESFGLAVVEAMAAGLPVIASDVGGLPELVTSEVGMVVNAGSLDEVVSAMESLLADEGLRRRLGAAGRLRARAFDWRICTDQMIEVLVEAAD